MSDDFDTPKTLFLFSQLFSGCYVYFESVKTAGAVVHVELLSSILRFLLQFVRMIGFDSWSGDAPISNAPNDDIIHFLEMRKCLKKFARKRKSKELFAVCDELRSRLRSCGVSLVDKENDEFSFRIDKHYSTDLFLSLMGEIKRQLQSLLTKFSNDDAKELELILCKINPRL